ncbi:MAG: hypothetical protein PBU97_18220 [Stenotrophomonas maltophilia]
MKHPILIAGVWVAAPAFAATCESNFQKKGNPSSARPSLHRSPIRT